VTVTVAGDLLTPGALALFGIERAPCHATYHYVFQSLDGDVLAKALGGFAYSGAALAMGKAITCSWSNTSTPS
jgi:hypothetical protein